MKFYFDGDSFTYGGGFREKYGIDPYNHRWSKLICDHYGAEETNLSKCGVSNDRVLRHLFAEDRDLEQYDFFFIQLTFPLRFEFWSTQFNEWIRFRVGKGIISPRDDIMSYYGKEHLDWENYYIDKIYSDKQGKIKERIAYGSIVSLLTGMGKPFIMLGLSPYNQFKWGYDFNHEEFNRISRKDTHPSMLGHKQIAEKVIHKVKDKL